jgi:hypothetical protein
VEEFVELLESKVEMTPPKQLKNSNYQVLSRGEIMQRSYKVELPSQVSQALEWLIGERIRDIMTSCLAEGESPPSGRDMVETIFGKESLKPSLMQVNVIPGRHSNGCHETLLVFCSGRDTLEHRLREAIDHIGNQCPGINKWILILTDKWHLEQWLLHQASFRALKGAYEIQVFRVMLDDPNLIPLQLI